ncbi:MAG: bifunctional nicotinamidase/pyrazinamidase [Rhodospirillales bacterium]
MPKASSRQEALLIIDVQLDFCSSGALAVPDGEAVVPVINRLQQDYELHVLTQDWHPPVHHSFATNHDDKSPFSTTELHYGTQVLWPDHCIQGSPGAEFHPDLQTHGGDVVIRKGFRPEIDSYSAFYENDRKTPTGLAGYLREREVTALALTGLATDFCVCYSALDAVALGFEVTLIEQACRAIDLEGSLQEAKRKMVEAGVKLDARSVL